MVQGLSKKKTINKTNKRLNSAKITKKIIKINKNKPKGRGIVLPSQSHRFREEAELDRQVTKAINKSNEQKIAAKVIQSGLKMKTSDIMQRGKELSREQKRSMVKKKVSRVEEKLNALKEAAEKTGRE